jgi:hypothetical protein
MEKFNNNPHSDETAPPPHIMAPEVWQEMARRRNDFLESLKGLSVEKCEVSKEEFKKIVLANQIVQVFLKEHKHDEGELEENREALKYLVSILDALTIWSGKFATECAGGASDDVDMQEYNSGTDSIYYTTHSGAVMRLKVVELSHGLRTVVQPFTEKTVFVGPEGDISEQPKEGYRVEEFVSPTFLSAVKDNKPEEYIPILKVYREGDFIKVISRTGNDGKESFDPNHTGNRVNKIF